ncbi:DUF3179 domain-containing (seleno)protein [Streptomyces sp. NPDC047706]|uniref:DUF3179 domain-containing (seleno)protein n=1 Tax=Streptomyces sp. NPDC047706 TaxID=3365486 RepID=UPI0037215DC9
MTAVQPGQDPSLEALAGAVVSGGPGGPGGPGKDGIPSIDKPRFIPASKAGFLDDDDPVFGLEYQGEVRAYPQLVLVWHEIVNDTVGGEPLAVTYCPLTGTFIAFSAPPGVQGLTTGGAAARRRGRPLSSRIRRIRNDQDPRTRLIKEALMVRVQEVDAGRTHHSGAADPAPGPVNGGEEAASRTPPA